MSWMKHTGSRYHTQDTNIGCGAAAAMMILAEIGVPYADLDQDDLYTSNHGHNAKPAGWATDPYGLEWTLDHRRPVGHNPFAVYKPITETEGTRKIVYTLHHYNVSPAVLVFHCQHWIVVPVFRRMLNQLRGLPTRLKDSGFTTPAIMLVNRRHLTMPLMTVDLAGRWVTQMSS